MKISELRCPSCSTPLKLTLSDPDISTCTNCGAVLDLNKEPFAVLTTVKPKKFPPRSFLRLGLEGKLRGTPCQIIGRICYEAQIREWDEEDKRYYREGWNFDEWLLVGAKKEYFFIYEDSDGWALENPFTPTNPQRPKDGEEFLSLIKDHPPTRVQEFTSAKIAHIEGEFTWVPRLGSVVESAEYTWGNSTYSVCWQLKNGGSEIAEIEFFRAVPLARLELAEAFNVTEIIEAEKARLERERLGRRWAMPFFLTSIVLGVLFLIALLDGGKKLAEFSADFAQIGEAGYVAGPFSLDKPGGIYRLLLASEIADNSSVWGGVELLDESQEVINAVEGDFWRESGTDEDGRWSESSVEESAIFRLERPGTYYARFFVDRGSEVSASTSGRVSLRVFEDNLLARYFGMAALLSLGLGFSLYRKQSLNPLYMVLGVLLLGGLLLKTANSLADED